MRDAQQNVQKMEGLIHGNEKVFSDMEGWLIMQYYMYYLLGTTAYFLAHVMHSSLDKLKQLRRGLRSLCSLP